MKSFYFSFFAFMIFGKKYSILGNEVKCTIEFCDDYVQRFPCPPLDPICSNATRSLVMPSPTVCNCCEHCFIFQNEGEDCIVGRPGQPLPNKMCKKGTECVNGICKKKTVPDSDFYPGYECKDGICHCAVLVNNEPKNIFGTFNESENLDKEKQCECSITAYRARKLINRVLPFSDLYLPILRCLPNGQFDPLQCINDMCGCVNGTTGSWDLNVRKVSVAALRPGTPECFNKERHRIGDYYTICEKERNNLMYEKSWGDTEGINILFSHKVECSPDGEYASDSGI